MTFYSIKKFNLVTFYSTKNSILRHFIPLKFNFMTFYSTKNSIFDILFHKNSFNINFNPLKFNFNFQSNKPQFQSIQIDFLFIKIPFFPHLNSTKNSILLGKKQGKFLMALR